MIRFKGYKNYGEEPAYELMLLHDVSLPVDANNKTMWLRAHYRTEMMKMIGYPIHISKRIEKLF